MDQGIAIFKRHAANQEALRLYKEREGFALGALINSAEQLSVKLDV